MQTLFDIFVITVVFGIGLAVLYFVAKYGMAPFS